MVGANEGSSLQNFLVSVLLIPIPPISAVLVALNERPALGLSRPSRSGSANNQQSGHCEQPECSRRCAAGGIAAAGILSFFGAPVPGAGSRDRRTGVDTIRDLISVGVFVTGVSAAVTIEIELLGIRL